MRVGFTGTQKGMTMEQKTALELLLRSMRPAALVHGACMGADAEADNIACNLKILRVLFPSNHPTKSRLAECVERGGDVIIAAPAQHPIERNPLIVGASTVLIACPSQPFEIIRSGTWTTVREGWRRLGRQHVLIIEPSGLSRPARQTGVPDSPQTGD